MKMLNIYIVTFIISFVLMFCSCEQNTESRKIPVLKSKQEKIERVLFKNGDTLDSGVSLILEGEKIPVNKDYVKKTKLKIIPKIISIENNEIISNEPKIISFKSSKTEVTPGENNIPLPKSAILSGDIVRVLNPKPVKAKEAGYRDNAILDIKCMEMEQGLNSTYVLFSYEDSKSNIWIGYFGGGLSKFDGEEYIHYTIDEGLSSNYVWSIFEDSNKILWFNHLYGGVTRYDGKTFTKYSEAIGFLGDDVSASIEDSNGNIWFATNKGAVKYDGNKFYSYTKENGLIDDFVISIVEDYKGHIWFGTLNSGLSRYDGKSFKSYTVEDGLPDNRITFLMKDSKQNLWMATNKGGVCKLKGNELSIYTKEEGLAGNKVMCIKEDREGYIWFGTYGAGISRFDGHTFFNIDKEDGLPHNEIRNILIDTKNNIWGSTEGVGLFKFKVNSFKNYLDRHSISFENIHTISEDKQGMLWFGTANHGLLKYDGVNFIQYPLHESLNIYVINTIKEDRKGNIWLGTYSNGIYMFDGHTYTQYTKESGLSDNTVWSIIEDKNGDIWFGTRTGGLSRFDGSNFTHYNSSNGFSSNEVTGFLEDNDKNIWITTHAGGVCKYNFETFTFYTEKEGLLDNIVWSAIEDQEKGIWFSTNKGLSYFRNGKFENYTEENGLINNVISGIAEDKKGGVWISTPSGLNHLTRASKGVRISKFTKNDGLKSSNFNSSSIAVDNNNNLWLGTTNSLSFVNLNSFNLEKQIPLIQLNTILINEKFIDYRGLIDAKNSDLNEFLIKIKNASIEVEDYFNYPKKLNLPYNFNHLNFQFSAIEWTAIHDVKYSYKVEGLDKEWSIASTDNYADYRNIPPGVYIFKVKAKGKHGIWSAPLIYKFSIKPAWWLSVWAITSYIIVIIILILIGFKWYTHRLKKKQFVLEKIVEERTKLIVDQKEALFKANKDLEQERNKMELKVLLNQINPHFVFNTLNSIQQFIIANNVKTSLEYFNKFGKLIRSSLEHSEKKFVSIKDEIDVISNYLELENLRFSKEISLQFNSNDIDIFNINIPPMFIQPIVENAIIHGLSQKEKDRKIKIEFNEFSNYILCSIYDNGLGRSQVKPIVNRNSGLVITQKRLKSIWGNKNYSMSKIDIEDLQTPSGTIVKIKLPKEIS